MAVGQNSRTYSIRDVAALTGLPASTLRYYESIGVTPQIDRGETSGHRVYSEDDLDLLTWVACLAATEMPVAKMREYLANCRAGADSAAQQIELLRTQDAHLADQAAQIVVRRRYIQLKMTYWDAVRAGDARRVEELAEQAAALAERLRRH